MNTSDLEKFLGVCLAITGERDREALLTRILDTAMDISHCDAGTLYLSEPDGLHFCRMATRSLNIRQGGHNDPITLPPVPLEGKYVCSWSALHRQALNISDVHTDTRFDFTGSLQYDRLTGYHTVSMLVVPMSGEKGQQIGVMQLINALDKTENIIAFPSDLERLISALASQAAISITNMQYAEQITSLLDSLVGALSKAIDERSPYTANHTQNMSAIAEQFLDYLDKTKNTWHFSPEKRRAFLMSVKLHDVGKVAIPLEIMDKESRLSSFLPDVQNRFRTIGLLDRIAMLEGRLSPEEYSLRSEDLQESLSFVERVNRAGFLSDEDLAKVDALASRVYTDIEGHEKPWITKLEHACLSIRKGTLTDAERTIIQSHVEITEHILSRVSFPEAYSDVPAWASSHHELLNGKGYPYHHLAPDISPETRLLTILDVFEALTARDRPYKPAIPLEKAISILKSMAQEGSIDNDILSLFLESRAWESVL